MWSLSSVSVNWVCGAWTVTNINDLLINNNIVTGCSCSVSVSTLLTASGVCSSCCLCCCRIPCLHLAAQRAAACQLQLTPSEEEEEETKKGVNGSQKHQRVSGEDAAASQQQVKLSDSFWLKSPAARLVSHHRKSNVWVFMGQMVVRVTVKVSQNNPVFDEMMWTLNSRMLMKV